MAKQELLKEYIKLLFETDAASPVAGFQLTSQPKKASSSQQGKHAIYREFPLHYIFDEEHEITFDCDVRYTPGRRSKDWYQPDDPEEVDFEDWLPVTLDGNILTPEEASRLKAFLGDLTEDEVANITNSYEPPERDYGDDY